MRRFHPETASTQHLGLVARREEDSLQLTLAGDLDMSAAFKVEPELDRLVAERDLRRLVLDVGAVEFIDSAGLGTLLSIRELTERLGIEMRVVNVPAPVRRIFELSGTSGLLPD